MPAKSKKQASAFGMALAARRGDIPPEELSGSAKLLFRDKSLSDAQLSDYAGEKTKELSPKHFGRPRQTWKRG